MIQINSNWEERTTVKKGNVGERLVNEWLIQHNYIPYSPDASGAHPFDRLVASRDKKTIFIADAKTKAKRKYYPDTGINISHYQEYKFIQEKYGIDVFIFFVDEESEEIYGNILKKLDENKTVFHNGKNIQYPFEYKGIRYFPIEQMKMIAKIPKKETQILKSYSTENEAYK